MQISQFRKNLFRTAALLCGFGLSLAVASLPVVAQGGKDNSGDKEFNLSIGVNKDAAAVGLPIYPGAWLRKDNADDNSATHFWASAFGGSFKLAVVKLGSKDTQDKIAMFYRRALARYGDVLVCSTGSMAAKNKGGKSSDRLDCGDDSPGPGGVVLKAGTKNDQHIVDIKPHGGGCLVDLVFVQVKGGDN